MKKALIISGGDFAPGTYKTEDLQKYDYVIAADKGLEYARLLNIEPNIVIGDFDSLQDKNSFNTVEKSKVLTFPIEKDDTDTMLAIKHAIEKGFKHIAIICALGGRLDHTMANIQSIAYAAKFECMCEIFSEKEYLRILSSNIEHSVQLPKIDNCSLSLFSLSEKCTGVSISGAKYNVENATLTYDFPLGVSNTWKDDVVNVSIEEGVLLIIESHM